MEPGEIWHLLWRWSGVPRYVSIKRCFYLDCLQTIKNLVCAVLSLGVYEGIHGAFQSSFNWDLTVLWYTQAYEHMWELKELFDPQFILNPSVLLNRDPATHVKHLKPSPPASKIVDRCIECGFCESNCPSKDLTLTPRQRITVYREVNRLRAIDNKTTKEDSRWALPHDCKKFATFKEHLQCRQHIKLYF